MNANLNQTKSIFVSVGDVSADIHLASVLKTLKTNNANLSFFGLGGSYMNAQGVELLYNLEKLTSFGIFEVMKHYPKLLKLKQTLLASIEERKPELVLLVDYGGFNLILAKSIRKRFADLPIVYLISPQVWGSRPWRINTIAKTVSKMLVIFPFEETLYKKHNVNVKFVGHPLTEKINNDSKIDLSNFFEKYFLDKANPIIGIFPGSRKQEIKDFIPVLIQAINWLHQTRPNVQFVLSCASHLKDEIHRSIEKCKMTHIVGNYLKLADNNDNYALMQASNILWVKSGTTTLEATLMETPMLIYYRAMWLSYVIFLLFKRVKYVGWPNLLAGSSIIPELIQLDCRAELLVRYTQDWLDVPAYLAETKNKLKLVRQHLANREFANSVANEILEIINSPKLDLKETPV